MKTKKSTQVAKKAPAKKPVPNKKAGAKKAPAKKAAPNEKAGAKKAPAKKAAVKKHAMQRDDYGAPIDGFFAKQPPALRAVLEALRALVENVVPEAQPAIKWGMPVYSIGTHMMCALGGHKSHVNLVLSAPADAFDDPDGLLEGSSKLGRHLKLTSVDQIPTARVRKWLRVAADRARK